MTSLKELSDGLRSSNLEGTQTGISAAFRYVVELIREKRMTCDLRKNDCAINIFLSQHGISTHKTWYGLYGYNPTPTYRYLRYTPTVNTLQHIIVGILYVPVVHLYRFSCSLLSVRTGTTCTGGYQLGIPANQNCSMTSRLAMSRRATRGLSKNIT